MFEQVLNFFLSEFEYPDIENFLDMLCDCQLGYHLMPPALAFMARIHLES